MKNMIIVYIACVNEAEAKKIGTHIMRKRLAPCYNVIRNTYSAAFWPPKSNEIEETSGAVLILKSIQEKYNAIENEVKSLHSDTNPCIFALPVSHVSEDYYKWLVSEMEAV